MKATFPARSAIGIAALVLTGLLSGCNDQEDPGTAVEMAAEPTPRQPRPPAGTAAAKGGELTAVATVRTWVAARNEALTTGNRSAADDLAGRECRTCARYLRDGRWRVESARVTQHTVDSATVAARISVTAESHLRERLTLAFEVTRVARSPMVTKIVVLP